MFTGIITHIGIVKNLAVAENKDLLITLELEGLAADRDFKIGSSIACNGVCLTLVSHHSSLCHPHVGGDPDKNTLEFQASAETLDKTNIKHWQIGDKINLEFALKMGDELGGHLVSGHIDDVVKVVNIVPINNDSWKFEMTLPKDLKKFIAPKGSVVLNGVSLTVNEVLNDVFCVNIIKHTFDNTTFGAKCGALKIGNYLNLEVDLIARYLARLTNCL